MSDTSHLEIAKKLNSNFLFENLWLESPDSSVSSASN